VTNDALPATLWEGRSVSYWLEQWRVPDLHVFGRTGSTNDVARALATGGAPAGGIVLAELQTAGRGRFGRRWEAAPGSSLLLSCLLRPRSLRDAVPGTIPLRVGLAAAAAIGAVTGTHVALKWPNDIVLAGAGKLGGILCEAVAAGNSWSVVAGIGINLRQRSDDWPPELRGMATSLDVATGATTDRAQLATALIERLRPLFTAPLAPLSAAELDAFSSRDALAGRAIVVDEEGKGSSLPGASAAGQRAGISAGIAPDGALLLRTTGGIERMTTGTVRICHEPGQRSDATTYP
jgi:BirA family transcriptional regulator, biotin operon repressor / biotin---[acetyl-CoA-carboxylase] ligase